MTSTVAAPAATTAAPTRAPATTSAPTTEPLSASPTPAAATAGHKICAVSDQGGFADRSFNQRVHDGLLTVEAKLGWEVATLESKSADDYFPHVAEFVNSQCDLIVAAGFLLADTVNGVAQSHPEQKLLLLDAQVTPDQANLWQTTYAVDQAAFLAGYAAAAASQTGVVGTFGGQNIPPVVDFMDGFALGVTYFNEQHGATVEVLGWDPAQREAGTFLGNFVSTEDASLAAALMIDGGADVIFPVAGPASFGAAQAALDAGNVYVIGVDTDWAADSPEYSPVVLTSVLKQLDATVFQAAEAIEAGSFEGGVHVGTLANGEVGLAAFTDSQNRLPEFVQNELVGLEADIAYGLVHTKP
jgi:basic membrane protein A